MVVPANNTENVAVNFHAANGNVYTIVSTYLRSALSLLEV